jgi:hypothetical protein
VAVVRASGRAEIGVEGEVVRIIGNGNAGIFVSFGALVAIDRTRITFNNNVGGDIVGLVHFLDP